MILQFSLMISMAITGKFSVFPDVCIPMKDIWRIQYRIVQKIDEHTYELVPGDPYLSGQRHAIIRTKKGTFNGTGLLRVPMMRHTAIIKVPLQNGFETTMDLWDTCACKDGKMYEKDYCPEDKARGLHSPF